jgi:hypothetical protein
MFVSKRRDPITHWCSVISEKNLILMVIPLLITVTAFDEIRTFFTICKTTCHWVIFLNIFSKHDTVLFNKQTVHQTGLYQSRNGFWFCVERQCFYFGFIRATSWLRIINFSLQLSVNCSHKTANLTAHLIQPKNLKYFHLALSKKLHPDIAHKIPEYENGCCSTHKTDLCSLKP